MEFLTAEMSFLPKKHRLILEYCTSKKTFGLFETDRKDFHIRPVRKHQFSEQVY